MLFCLILGAKILQKGQNTKFLAEFFQDGMQLMICLA